MTLFDLLFIVLFLAGVIVLCLAASMALRGRRPRARAILRGAGICAGLYLAVIVAVSLLTPQRFIKLGDDQCADDWCIAISTSGRNVTPEGTRFEVTFRLSSRARRVAQRERFVAVSLRDSHGARYDPEVDPHAIPFDTLLEPLQAITASRRFLVPQTAEIVGLVVERAGVGSFPGCCIIGDEGSLLHKPTIVRLD